MSVEDLGVLVDVLGAWAYATGYGPPFTCPVPLTSYSTPSRVAPCGCGRQALESLAGPRWTRQELNLDPFSPRGRGCSHNRTHTTAASVAATVTGGPYQVGHEQGLPQMNRTRREGLTA